MDWKQEAEGRIAWIQELLAEARASGIVLGLSGGKDSAVVGALCKQACPRVLGVMMPCQSLDSDREDALRLAARFQIETLEIDISAPFLAERQLLQQALSELPGLAEANIKPRLRMTTLYAVAQARGYLVAGTSNRSERAMGYFTKWGDGACDFNPIADLTVREVLWLGEALDVPGDLLHKAPSAGLWPGQTDESELGISYAAIDAYLLEGQADAQTADRVARAFRSSEHKRQGVKLYRQLDRLPENRA